MHYVVERRNANKQAWIKVGQTDAQTLQITATKLTEDNDYFFRVFAENSIGISEPCTTDEPIRAKLPFGEFPSLHFHTISVASWNNITQIFSTDKPGPPINLKANNTTKTSTVLTWEPPESDGGSPIKGYYVEKMPSYSTRWTKVQKALVTDLTLALTDLEEGTEYKFRVMAENEAGVGEPCEMITVIAKDPYG